MQIITKLIWQILLPLMVILLSACGGGGGSGGDGGNGGNNPPPPAFTVMANVSGLAGSGLQIQNAYNNETIDVLGNGPVTFSAQPDGSLYTISVARQPTALSQTCSVGNASDTIQGANVTNVDITCVTNHYTIRGTVTGLDGEGLTLQSESTLIASTEALVISGDGPFGFLTSLPDGSDYSASVQTDPMNNSQTCTVSNGAGTLAGADIGNVQVDCVTNRYTVSVLVIGLANGNTLDLFNNGGDLLTVNNDGSFPFSQTIFSGSAYVVTAPNPPTGPTAQTCTVNSGSNTVTDSDITVTVNCAASTFSIGGTVTGLITNLGTTGVTLRFIGHDSVTVTQNGSFTFIDRVVEGGTYLIDIPAQPTNPTQTCVFLNNSHTGSDIHADVMSIAVECIDPTVSGNLDPDFGINGVSLIDIESRLLDDYGKAVSVVLPDGKILVAGTTRDNNSLFDFALVRLNSDGTLDDTFNQGNNGGYVRTDLNNGSNDQVTAMAVDSQGRILVVGDTLEGQWNIAVVRYDAEGVLDTSFGNNGIVITDLKTASGNSALDHANAIAVFDDDSFVVAGRTIYSGGYNDFALVRYDAAGIPDPNFNGGDINNVSGAVHTGFGDRDDIAYAVAIDANDRIVAAGYAVFRTGTSWDFALARYNSDGSLDTSFGPDATGKVTTHLRNTESANAIAIQPTGEIVVGGYSNAVDKDFVVLRYTDTGDLDTTFNGTGFVTTNITGQNDEIKAVLIDDLGNIVAAGNTINAQNNSDFTLIRYTPSGALDTNFGTSGIISTAVGGDNDEVYGMALHPDGIVVAGQAQNGSHVDFAVIRVNP